MILLDFHRFLEYILYWGIYNYYSKFESLNGTFSNSFHYWEFVNYLVRSLIVQV